MSQIEFRVVYALWGCDDHAVYEGGVHTVEDPDPSTFPVFAGGAAAGAIEILPGTSPELADALGGHVQSQADGEAAYAQAVADGSWLQGHLQVFVEDQTAKLADVDDPDRQAVIHEAIALAKAHLDDLTTAADSGEENS